MNILLIYNKIPWTTAQYLEKSLRKKHQVETFDLGPTPYFADYIPGMPIFIPKGLPVSIFSILKKFGKVFDVIIETDGRGCHHVRGLKKISIPTAYWALDTFVQTKKEFHLIIQKDFKYLFVAQKDLMSIFNRPNSYWLTYACDPEIHKKFPLKKIYDIVFVGTPGVGERRGWLEKVSQKFDLKIFTRIYGQEMAKIYSQSKIVFNVSPGGDLNMRVFEALSCGSFLITNRIGNGLLELFEDRKHLVAYDENNWEELIDYYLRHDEEREKISQEGQKEVHLKHTYDLRAEFILEKILEGNK